MADSHRASGLALHRETIREISTLKLGEVAAGVTSTLDFICGSQTQSLRHCLSQLGTCVTTLQ